MRLPRGPAGVHGCHAASTLVPSFQGLVQYNEGFRTGLIGTPEQIAERIIAHKRLGVDLFLPGFLHYPEDVEYCGLTAPPKNQRSRAACASTASHCSRVPTSRAAQFHR